MTQTLALPRPRATAPRSVIRVTGQWELAGTFVKTVAAEATPGTRLDQIMAQVTARPSTARVHIVSPSGVAYGPIPPEHWHWITPQLGRTVVVRLVPQGGQGGDDKQTERLVIQLVIVLVATIVGAGIGGIFGTLAAAAIQIGGTLLLNELMPPTMPGKLKTLSGVRQREQESPTLTITGSRNRANPYGPIPVIYGAAAVYPPFACA